MCAGSQFDPAITEAFFDVWADRTGAWPTAVAS
jgi:hypothetical protein